MVFLPGMVVLPNAYASQVMPSAMRRLRTMAKASTALVIQGDGRVLLRSQDSLMDALYRQPVSVIRMLHYSLVWMVFPRISLSGDVILW